MKGQILVESVIVFPVLIIFLICIIQIGILFNTYYIVNYASFCGARSAIVHTQLPDNPGSYAQRSSRMVLSSIGVKGAVLSMVTLSMRNTELEVKVTYPVKIFIPFIGKYLPYIPISASTRLPVEK